MKRYIKAEWMLYRKNQSLLTTGLLFWVIYLVLSFFSVIGGPVYSALITVVGFIGLIYLFLPMLYTPGYWVDKLNRKKHYSQQLLLCLGESKRFYYLLRYVAFYLLLAGSLLSAAIVQIPAYFLFSDRYSLLFFGIEVMIIVALFHFFMVMICLVHARHMNSVMPCWCGGYGGIWGGLVGEGIGEKQGAEYYFRFACILTLIATAVAVISMIFRYVVTVSEEKGKKQRKG